VSLVKSRPDGIKKQSDGVVLADGVDHGCPLSRLQIHANTRSPALPNPGVVGMPPKVACRSVD
jgi:hypothetical protein